MLSLYWLQHSEKILKMIVSFSGIDSAGKTTQIEKLTEYLDAHQVKYIKKWSKARGTPGVEFLKSLVRKETPESDEEKVAARKEIYKSSKKQRLLYAASLLDLCWYWGVYYRWLNLTHKYLICDRYLWDTYVEMKHDFYSIDIDHSFLWKMVRFCTPKPKVSFVFIIPAELSLARDLQKGTDGTEDIERKKSKIDVYMSLVEQKKWTNVMDGTKTRETLHQEVLDIIGIGNGN